MQPRNLLFIMSDEHSRRVLGCHGHPMIATPNLDRLASRGVRFTDAYAKRGGQWRMVVWQSTRLPTD